MTADRVNTPGDAPGDAGVAAECAPLVPGLCGLANLGNTCYMNAALQCLSHTLPLTEFVLAHGHELTSCDVEGAECEASELTPAYQRLLHEMWRGKGGVIKTASFRERLCRSLPQFEGRQQHDSPEFLEAFLNRVHEEYLRAGVQPTSVFPPAQNQLNEKESNRSQIHALFSGSLRNTLHCPGCSSDFVQQDEFLSLPVPLPLSETKALRIHVIQPMVAECVQYGLSLPFWASVGDVLEQLVQLAQLPSQARLAVFSGGRVRHVLPSSHSVSAISPEDVLFAIPSEPCDCNSLATDILPAPSPQAVALVAMPASETFAKLGNEVAAPEVSMLEPSEPETSGNLSIEVPSELPPLVLPEAPHIADVIALPPPPQEEIPPLVAAIALPPPPLPEVVQRPVECPRANGVLALSAPETSGMIVKDANVQQVACVCGVEEAVARRALLLCFNDLDRAVVMVLENPEALTAPSATHATDSCRKRFPSPLHASALKRSNSDPSIRQAEEPGLPLRPLTPAGAPRVRTESGEVFTAARSAHESFADPLQRKLSEAVSRADVGKVREAVAEGADIQATDIVGSGLLNAALSSVVFDRLREKHMSTIRFLLTARASPEIVDESGRCLCHRLATCGSDLLLTELWVQGMLRLEACDDSGQTVLHKSAAAGHSSTVALLLQWGAECETIDKQKQTPAAIAAEKGKEDVLDELFERPRLVPFVHRQALDMGTGSASEPAEGKTAAAHAAKKAGNECLKVGDFPKAIEQYTIGIVSMSNDESELVADCFNNRAAAHMQLRNYENVVADATQCLQRFPANGKALVRRAQAYQQLEKLKAALADATQALQVGSLSANFARIARTVHKEVRSLLLADGVEVAALDMSAPPPIVGVGIESNSFQCRYTFLSRPFIVAVPRSRVLSGRELYALAWRHATCGADFPSTWNFELRSVGWSAEDDGQLLPCDGAAVALPHRGAVALDWRRDLELPVMLQSEPVVKAHKTAEELQAEEAKGVSLEDCLDSLVAEHTLTGDDMWRCSTCQRPQEVATSSIIERCPHILVLHLKRFYYTRSRQGKISAPVKFPVRGLNLGPWCLNSADKPLLYDLFAVVNHHGGFGAGHYTAYAKPSSHVEGRDPDVWHDFNDSKWTAILEDSVVTRDAYLLFYSLKGDSMP